MLFMGFLIVWFVMVYVYEYVCKLGNFLFLRNYIFVGSVYVMGVFLYGISRF